MYTDMNTFIMHLLYRNVILVNKKRENIFRVFMGAGSPLKILGFRVKCLKLLEIVMALLS